MMWAQWWVWIVAAFALGVAEVILPGYIFLGFAGGAVITGILVGFGLLGHNLPLLLAVFAIASLGSWLLIRRLAGVRQGQIKIWDKDINDN